MLPTDRHKASARAELLIGTFIGTHTLTSHKLTECCHYYSDAHKRTFRLSGSSCRPAYPGFIVMKMVQVGLSTNSVPSNTNFLTPWYTKVRTVLTGRSTVSDLRSCSVQLSICRAPLSLIFMVHSIFFWFHLLLYLFTELSLVGLALDLVD